MLVVTDIRFTLDIEKQEPEQRRFWGKGYIFRKADGEQVVDTSGDVIDTPEAEAALEEAFYKYVDESRAGDSEHAEFGAAKLIEGVVVTAAKKAAGLFPSDMDEGLYLGFQAEDSPEGEALWEGVKSGRLTALSIVGTAEVEDI